MAQRRICVNSAQLFSCHFPLSKGCMLASDLSRPSFSLVAELSMQKRHKKAIFLMHLAAEVIIYTKTQLPFISVTVHKKY